MRVRVFMYTDGHDKISADLLYRYETENDWQQIPLEHDSNDEWEASFTVEKLGVYYFSVWAWNDPFFTWQYDIEKKYQAGQDITVEMQIGVRLIESAAERADGFDAEELQLKARRITSETDIEQQLQLALSEELRAVMRRYPETSLVSRYHRELQVRVDREKALFSAWYEMFPRSAADEDGKHGTFRDCEARLDYIARLGFDVLYLPPIHPIGTTYRKGKNNSPVSGVDDVGSCWAIGSPDGGHKSIHPELGNLDDFKRLMHKAKEHDIEIAMDIAFQCSPDHPYVKEHPEWFLWRPDGKVQFAENPPKKYEDIIPIHFETPDWPALWNELKSVFEYWIEQGVYIFRVDNPHTKPFRFWEWVIGEIKREHPEVIFLSEAFTRSKVMKMLAKAGFTQSYTYFTWRNTKWELEEYLTELTATESGEYYRPNFWPNTPDILPDFLQYSGRSGFIIRFILAATLSSNYGMYGPAYEVCENAAIEGREEYYHSEKYELKNWDRDRQGNIRKIIELVNRIRKENPALHRTRNLHFCGIENEKILGYLKISDDGDNLIVVAVNLDPHYRQAGWLFLPLEEMGIAADRPFLMHDLISDDKYIWQGHHHYVELDPHAMPAHIFAVHKRLHRETDFDYFL